MTITVTRGMTMVAGAVWDVDDWNAAFLPNVVISGGVVGSDIEDGAITPAKLNSTVFSGLTAETALATADRVPFWDASASANKYITVANALNGVFSLAPVVTAFTSYSADVLTLHNGTAAGAMTVARAAENLVAQAPSLASTADADEVLVHDASATAGSRAARVTLANLLPDKATAGTYRGIQIDAKGRVLGVTESAIPTYTRLGTAPTYDLDFPPHNSIASWPWAGSDVPRQIVMHVVCSVPAASAGGWQEGDILTIESVRGYQTSATESFPGLCVWFEGSGSVGNRYVRVRRATEADSFYIPPKTGIGASVTFTPSEWKLRGYCVV